MFLSIYRFYNMYDHSLSFIAMMAKKGKKKKKEKEKKK